MMPVRHMRVRRGRERGVFWVLYALLLVPMIWSMGFALDLGFAYTRRGEMQSVADSAALAAARALNGTLAGINTAKNNARSVAEKQKYSFVRRVEWSDEALRFSSDPDAPDGDWLPAGAINAANVGDMYFAKVDTSHLSADHGQVSFVFMRGNGDSANMSVGARAVAGRTTVPVTPLAVCALRNVAVSSRDVIKVPPLVEQELVEYGFRRGVSYNLLGMNPTGPTALSYQVNPLDFPNAPQAPTHTTPPVLRPFLCSGTMGASRIRPNSRVYVSAPFPPELTIELNVRFNAYGGSSCNSVTAPPDRNIKPYNVPYFAWWMNSTAAIGGSVRPHLIGGNLLTIADQSTAVAGTDNTSYGPLWAFSKPVRYDSAATGGIGAAFGKDDWQFLYPTDTGVPLASNHPDALPSPYVSNMLIHRTISPIPGLKDRRILHVPLLECPVAGAVAKVLAIGRFFMTAPADAATPAVHGEFGGLSTDAELRGTVALQR